MTIHHCCADCRVELQTGAEFCADHPDAAIETIACDPPSDIHCSLADLAAEYGVPLDAYGLGGDGDHAVTIYYEDDAWRVAGFDTRLALPGVAIDQLDLASDWAPRDDAQAGRIRRAAAE